MLAADTSSAPMASVKTLLEGAIDYAGLFPPAALSMPEAIINYATYRNSNYNWMLGRFVVQAARLDEFSQIAGDFVSRDAVNAWRVSVIAGDDLYDTIKRIQEFNAAYGPGLVCDTVEIKGVNAGLIENAANSMPSNITAYFELDLDENLGDLISTLSLTGQPAKIRTGGLTPESFPSTHDIIRFVRACMAADVPFKATAGLHHPIRCFKPLTYESDAPSGTMHGFLNLFLMTGFAREGYRPTLLEEVMEDEFEEVFKFEDQAIKWRDEFVLGTRQLEILREKGIQSFGSCSFDEPVSELQAMGVL
jgi:hypothetical protein